MGDMTMWFTSLLYIAGCFTASLALDPPVFVDHGLSPGSKGCSDRDRKCQLWANQGECESNSAWMMSHCRRSCQSCQGGERAWKLRAHISRTYDNSSTTKTFLINRVTVVSFKVSHVEVSEKTQTTRIHGNMVMTWNDSRVSWDPKKWDVPWLSFYWVQIWIPKLVQKDAPQNSLPSIKWKTLAANYTGQVYMWVDFSLTTLCPFDYSTYPMDKQECFFSLDDKRYFVVHFNVSNSGRSRAQRSRKDAHVAGWKLTDVDLDEQKYQVPILSTWDTGPYDIRTTSLRIRIGLRRRNTYHSAEIIGPCVTTAIVTLTSFLVYSMHHQIWMLLSSLGLQILALQTLDVKLPPPMAGVPLVVQFYSLNLALTSVILISIILLIRLAGIETDKPPPRCLDNLLDILCRLSPCLRPEPQADERTLDPDAASASGSNNRKWAPAAQALRCLLFVLFTVFYILAMISCLRA